MCMFFMDTNIIEMHKCHYGVMYDCFVCHLLAGIKSSSQIIMVGSKLRDVRCDCID